MFAVYAAIGNVFTTALFTYILYIHTHAFYTQPNPDSTHTHTP